MISSGTRKRAKVSYIDEDSEIEQIENKKPVKRKRNKKSHSDDEFEINSRPNVIPSVTHLASLHCIKDAKTIRTALLGWYAGVHEARGMPWRKPFDPSLDAKGRSQRAYEVWISEIMLQQTQVATVIPYYNKWMEKFPTIKDLARSDIESVNAIWKGLGYYSRAARLLSGAQKIVKEYDGIFPDNAKDMIENVPGIGRYSAGAISSIAYNQCEPVLDGNVNRLLSRMLALHANPKGKATLDILWSGAEAMVVDADRPGDTNQALIELGATVCKPRDPNCSSCPLTDHCNAYLESRNLPPQEQDIEELCSLCEPVTSEEDAGVMRYPMKVVRKKAREEIDLVNIVEWRSPQKKRFFLLVRRPEKGLLAGLHEFPSRVNVEDNETKNQTSLRRIGQTELENVLKNSVPPYTPSNLLGFKPKNNGESKTYRIQWILLEGLERPDGKVDPPEPNTNYVFNGGDNDENSEETSKVSRKGRKKKEKASEKVEENKPGKTLRWVEYDEVSKANIGTGVMKVWKKANEAWATPTLV